MSLTFDSATRSDCSFDERRDNITGMISSIILCVIMFK